MVRVKLFSVRQPSILALSVFCRGFHIRNICENSVFQVLVWSLWSFPLFWTWKIKEPSARFCTDELQLHFKVFKCFKREAGNGGLEYGVTFRKKALIMHAELALRQRVSSWRSGNIVFLGAEWSFSPPSCLNPASFISNFPLMIYTHFQFLFVLFDFLIPSSIIHK